MNLLAWMVALWLVGAVSRWVFGWSPIAGWAYVALVGVVVGQYFYIQTVVPVRKKLREIDERMARSDKHEDWSAETLGYVKLGRLVIMLSTTMFGRRGIRRYYIGEREHEKGVGLETRYVCLGVTWLP
jgi:hypothetical protein